MLLNGDWKEAERMLYSRNYPPVFQDRYELLALRISEIKGQEEKIVIRFHPGSSAIPVTALINGTIRHDFLVDTGASMVTIPSSSADSLGLEIANGERNLSTAGGMVKAHEVTIATLEIEGWVEYNVRAYVLDLPGRPGVGLLGLNYLGRFRMDLKTDEGTLMLTPR
jgi:clan AA aspartic protease (TIGR02281 family)